MERLTKRCVDGMAYVPIDEVSRLNEECVGLPITKLSVYEDLKEQGLLLHLPCKVGDTVYEPRPDRGFISVYEITLITISGTSIFYKWMLIDGIYSNLDGFSNDKIRKTVFLSRKEAEQKLKELQKDGVNNGEIS